MKWHTLLSTAFFTLTIGLLVAHFGGFIPLPWPVLLYVIVSIITFFFYQADKAAAKRQGRRISEATLHGLELLGGWPGAYVGQRQFRHKTKKLSFRATFWFIVTLHIAFWGFWFYVLNCGLVCDEWMFIDRALAWLKYVESLTR